MTTLYTDSFPDDRIRDRSVPARERLLECLWHLLEPVGVSTDAREMWAGVFDTFIGPAATDQARAGYLVLEQKVRGRVLGWLAILEEEGALRPGDNERRADFLLAVVDGLSVARALPAVASRLAAETYSLQTAVDAVVPADGTQRS